MEKVILAVEDEKKIFNHFDENKSESAIVLEEAKKETESTSYDGIEEIKPEEINETEQHYKDAFSPYGLSDDEARQFMAIINEYKSTGSASGLYEKLPSKIRFFISNIAANANKSINSVTRDILESFISDAKRAAAVDMYNSEMKDLIKDTEVEYNKIYSESLNDIFSKIDEIRKENPEKADKIESVKKAFDRSKTLDEFLEYIKTHNFNTKKLYKRASKLNNETFYINSKFSHNDIKLSKIEDIPGILSMYIDEYDVPDIAAFTVLLIDYLCSLDLDDLSNVSYAYKLIENLYSFRFKYDISTEEDKLIEQIKESIEIIKK